MEQRRQSRLHCLLPKTLPCHLELVVLIVLFPRYQEQPQEVSVPRIVRVLILSHAPLLDRPKSIVSQFLRVFDRVQNSQFMLGNDEYGSGVPPPPGLAIRCKSRCRQNRPPTTTYCALHPLPTLTATRHKEEPWP